MNFDAVWEYQPERSKEEFLREVMIKLARNGSTPVDVVKANFGAVRQSFREAIVCSAHIECDYSASVGYDRVEEYWDSVKKYDSNTKSYYYEKVKKTRTVTDWRPFSGHIAGNKTAAAFNDAGGHSGIGDNDLIVDVIKSAGKDNGQLTGTAELTAEGLSSVKHNCAFFLETEISYPGDRKKDVRTHSDVTVESISCYKLPIYTVDYTYKGKTYTATGFACGNINLSAQTPPNDVNIEAEVAEATKQSLLYKRIGWWSFLGLFILSCILNAVGVHWTFVLPAAALAASIYFHLQHNRKCESLQRELKGNNVTQKGKALAEALPAMGLAPLTDAEMNSYFNVEKEIDSYVATHAQHRIKLRAIVCGIATVILAIVSISSGVKEVKAKNHSPKQVEIKLVELSHSEEDTEVYLKYDVAVKKYGIDAITITTYVYDKEGNEITSVTTRFRNMDLEENSNKKITSTLSYNRSDGFAALYNGSMDTLEFKHEIEYIYFADGEFYELEDN